MGKTTTGEWGIGKYHWGKSGILLLFIFSLCRNDSSSDRLTFLYHSLALCTKGSKQEKYYLKRQLKYFGYVSSLGKNVFRIDRFDNFLSTAGRKRNQ